MASPKFTSNDFTGGLKERQSPSVWMDAGAAWRGMRPAFRTEFLRSRRQSRHSRPIPASNRTAVWPPRCS
jgi:hypothetical protein